METISQWLTSEAYSDVRALIFSQTKNFVFQHGGDFSELLAEAIYIFIRANYDFQPGGRMKYSTYIAERVWNGLIDYRKKRWKWPEPLLDDLIESKLIQVPSYSNRSIHFLTDLLDRISHDSQFVVKSVLNPDICLKRTFQRARRPRPRHMRMALRRYLIRHHNWNEDRIDDCFWELAKVLR